MILCCGEALIDMIPTPTTGGREGFVPHSGGAIYNTAIALGRLGARVGMLTGLSTDQFGQQLARDLAASHVDTTHVIHAERPSTLAFVHLEGGHATYTFFDEGSAGRMIAPGDLPQLADHVSALYFGGISLACEPGADTYAGLAQANAARKVVMLDPNIRPGFIEDEARYRDRLTRLIACADIVKVSDEDLNWIFPGPDSLEDKVDRLRGAGVRLVILTRGADGASGWGDPNLVVHVPGRQATVVDTVGAGDTFNAGVLAWLSRHGLLTKSALTNLTEDAIKDALDFGARVAAVTVSRAGANPPWQDDL